MKALFMETTRIPPDKTVAEIQQLLGRYGCSGVMTLYDKKEIKSVCFKIRIREKEVAFKLPARWESIFDYFVFSREQGRRFGHKAIDDEIQAKRVAWRQIFRWIQAQLALVDTNMVKIQEVFMPYIQVNLEGQTLYERLEQTKFKMIEDKTRS